MVCAEQAGKQCFTFRDILHNPCLNYILTAHENPLA